MGARPRRLGFAGACLVTAVVFTVTPAGAQEPEPADSAAAADTAARPGSTAPAGLMGRVLASDSTPLPDAVVVLPEYGLGARTDSRGNYGFTGLPAGETVIEVRWGEDRRSASRRIELVPDSLNRVDVRLRPDPVEVPGIAVTVDRPIPRGKMAGFHLRMEEGRGAYVTRAEIEEINANELTDVFRRVAGVQVVRNRRYPGIKRLKMGRAQPTFTGEGSECRPVYFLDGQRFEMGESDTVDRVFDTDEVEAIEVYRGAAEVPALFNVPGARCGVVAIWTRER